MSNAADRGDEAANIIGHILSKYVIFLGNRMLYTTTYISLQIKFHRKPGGSNPAF
jgi:hypothetical protein